MYYSNACGMKWFGKIEFFSRTILLLQVLLAKVLQTNVFLIVGFVDVYIALTYVCF